MCQVLINKVMEYHNKNKIRRLEDYTRIRNEKIKGNEEIANEKWFFYYDETANIGKLCINLEKEYGFNCSPITSFVVGGVWSCNEITNEQAEELICEIKGKRNIKEVKFEHVFGGRGRKGDFEKILKNRNLDVIIDWMERNEVYFQFVEFGISHMVMKELVAMLPGKIAIDEANLLRKLFVKNSKKIANLLNEVHYPDITDYQYFWKKVGEIFDEDLKKYPSYKNKSKMGIEYLKICYENDIARRLEARLQKTLKKRKRIPDNFHLESGVLVRDLAIPYLLPVIIFINSHHFFDNEANIKKMMETDKIYIDKQLLKNYSFVNVYENKILVSEEKKVVYVCDWIVGIMHSIITYLKQNGRDQFYSWINGMDIEEKRRFIRLCKLIKKSNENNPFSFLFMDDDAIAFRFNWLIDFELTMIRASLSE